MPVLTDLTKSDSFLTNSDFTKDRTTVRKLWTADWLCLWWAKTTSKLWLSRFPFIFVNGCRELQVSFPNEISEHDIGWGTNNFQ